MRARGGTPARGHAGGSSCHTSIFFQRQKSSSFLKRAVVMGQVTWFVIIALRNRRSGRRVHIKNIKNKVHIKSKEGLRT